jgi:hypothetical protein
VHLYGARNGRFEVVYLKPEQNTIAVRFVARITDRPMVMLNLEPMQLQDQNAIRNKPLILWATVCASASEQAPIPAAACLDIVYGNQRLGAHVSTIACISTISGRRSYVSRLPRLTSCSASYQLLRLVHGRAPSHDRRGWYLQGRPP